MLAYPKLLSEAGTGFTSSKGHPFRLKPVKGGFVAEGWLDYGIWAWSKAVEEIIEKDYDTRYRTSEAVQAFIDAKQASQQMSDDDKAFVELALKIATEAHKGQKDKGGNDYILHPIAVAEKLTHPYCKVVALLHDVLEDTDETEESLIAKGIHPYFVDAISALTKKKGVSEKDYLMNIATFGLARAVKLADLEHNCDLSRIPNPTEKDIARVEKYKRQIEFIENYGYEKA